MTENGETHIKTLYESVGRGFESLPSHQEKPVHFVYWFFFFGAKEDLKKEAAHCAASKAPVGFCLACGFQPVGTSTGRTAAKIENPNLFSIGEGFGFFVSG